MLDSVIITIGIATALLFIFQKWQIRQQKLPPGPFRIPGLGNCLQIMQAESMHHALDNFARKYGEIVYLHVGISKAVSICGYKAAKRVMSSDDFLNHSDAKWLLDRTYGKPLGLFFASEEIWKETRTFSMKTLRDFGFKSKNTQELAIQREYEFFSEMVQAATKDTDGLINSKGLFTPPFFNSVWMMVAGVRLDYNDAKFKGLIEYSRRWFSASTQGGGSLLSLYPFLATWAPKLVRFNELHEVGLHFQEYFEDLLKRTMAEGNYLKEPTTFIEVFLKEIDAQMNNNKNNRTFTIENLACVLMDMFFGGSDTSTTLMTLAVFYMIQYPQIQEAVRNEIDNVVGKEKYPLLNDKDKLPLTNAVLLEVYRLGSIVPIAPRKVHKDVVYDNYVIPKGSDVFVSLYSIHMDEDFWGDPHVFRPSRFLAPDSSLINTDRVLPFAYGKRICIGENTSRVNSFLFFSRLMQQYTFAGDPAKNGAVNTNNLPGGLTQSPHACNFVMKLRK